VPAAKPFHGGLYEAYGVVQICRQGDRLVIVYDGSDNALIPAP
jgi:hypothetical protein